ncbi:MULTISPECIES: UDP-N-acetylmuramate--L-alanine ligase [unclassified Nocardioides]|uniref:UDP-N-acetylmuramate--L-alanine ligase n=1 Tax=unclassified Nocardioides TaxID=2615069 RepID=UPI0006FA8878|nr:MULTISPECIES: UDP-N-acetylmuramate--L-alanine ligase [unclassified Nocardioides]KRA37368.1 UDP-N-acetylmuramate--alanine ligase [Nocardioides sp. Root614]KRA91329.1 UDP-N-acetylmuramate--alanine ligase [Nocardioides sp. Root682]
MKIPVPAEILPAEQLGRVHFVGIGGAGLSGIARLMHQQGITVSGSDANDSVVVQALRSEGITVHVGHSAAQVDGVDTVVATTAAREDNPEIVAAQAQGLRLWPRSAGLQSVLIGKRVVAVAGTHGKTTTTAMLTVALQEAGLDPTFVIGAEVETLGTNARLGTGDVAVVEADESDGAFLVYTPEVAVVTNVDADHLDHWGTPEAYAAAFAQFVAGASSTAVVSADDPGSAALADSWSGVASAGFEDGADLQGSDFVVVDGGATFRVRAGEDDLGVVTLAVPGRHYAQDALLALAAGLDLGADPAALIRGLARHRGAKRRMELIGEAAGVRVYDSYAHHPSEIRGDLEAARSLVGDTERLVVCFQPHLVSRTRIFGVEMGEALGAADEVVVLDVYVAREDPDPQVTGALVSDAVPLPSGQVRFVSERDQVVVTLSDIARPGDLVLMLGAGDVTALAPELLAVLVERS